jgi:hypothetical protein
MTERDLKLGPAKAPVAVAILPAAEWLPANILRFYVHFSAPAEAVFEREQLRLLASDGDVIPDAFLILNEELWSPDGRRLTILMEPGRIKRGMGPDSKHPPALVPHDGYRLEISTGGQTHTKTFWVLPPMMEPLLEKNWQVAGARARSRSALEVTFDRMMDDAIAVDEVVILRSDSTRFDGVQSLTMDGRRLIFEPAKRWEDEEYRIIFSRRFEDMSGNRLGEALDHMVSQGQRSRAGVMTFRAVL